MTSLDPKLGSRILYIDDDPGLCRLVARHLARAGYQVQCAHSGEDGLAVLAEQHFDLVALDHHMPGQGGLETLRAIVASEANPPVVYVTGAEDSRLAVAALKAGASDYVMKSDAAIFFELLDEAVRTSLERVIIRRQKEEAAQEVAEANTRLAALVSQQQTMLREVDHRVANSLQIMGALVRLQAAASNDDAVRQALLDTQSRIHAIAYVHRHLYTSANVENVDLSQYLTSLTSGLEQSLVSTEKRIVVERDVARCHVPTDTAVSVGIIVAELVTNAFKYAFTGRTSGKISLSVAKLESGAVRIVVRDDGVGFDGAGVPEGTGVGSKIVSSMARGLKAKLDQASDANGTVVSLEIPGPASTSAKGEGPP